MEDLVNITVSRLLEKFGVGSHKPGSGSAAALEGMISSQLLRTVIELTSNERRPESYKKSLPILNNIKSEIEDKIFPELSRLFQLDSQQFHKVVTLRETRDKEKVNSKEYDKLNVQSLQALKTSTETPIIIAKLSLQLCEFSIQIFDLGFKSARGDSGVAMNNARSAVAGCIAIINLNLLSFGSNEWSERTKDIANKLKREYQLHSVQIEKRLESLELQVSTNLSFDKEKQALNSGLWLGKTLSNNDIEQVARRLQNTLWTYREKIYKGNVPQNHLEILKPNVVLKLLGYNFNIFESLGAHAVNDEYFEVAGIIDKRNKSVSISNNFSKETQNFTAAHELGHALFHKGIVQHRDRPFDGQSNSRFNDIKELQADKFATYFLMPTNQVQSIFKELFGFDELTLNDNTIFALTSRSVKTSKSQYRNLHELAKIVASSEFFIDKPFRSIKDIFNVSTEAMAIRLQELQLVKL